VANVLESPSTALRDENINLFKNYWNKSLDTWMRGTVPVLGRGATDFSVKWTLF
jgi:hypothetical protein